MSRVQRALFFQAASLLLAAAVVLWLARHYPVLEYLKWAQQRLARMGNWAGLTYPLLYAACNVLLLPGGAIAIGSGLFFGLWWGFFFNVAGSVVSAAISFSISRWLGREWVRRHLLRHSKWTALDAAVGREGWKIVFLSQVHPLAPSSLLNYLYGITRMSLRTCLLWVALGQAPGAFLYAYLGTLAQLGLRLLRGETHPHRAEYVLWIGGLLLAFLVTTIFGRLALRLLAEAEEHAAGPLIDHIAEPPQVSLPL